MKRGKDLNKRLRELRDINLLNQYIGQSGPVEYFEDLIIYGETNKLSLPKDYININNDRIHKLWFQVNNIIKNQDRYKTN